MTAENLNDAVEAYLAGILSESELSAHLGSLPECIRRLIREFHVQAMRKRRALRREIRLWHFRQSAVLSTLYLEKRDCEAVIAGGSAASVVSCYLGPLGQLKWLRDNKGDADSWTTYVSDLREYAMARSRALTKRIHQVEAMRPEGLRQPVNRSSGGLVS